MSAFTLARLTPKSLFRRTVTTAITVASEGTFPAAIFRLSVIDVSGAIVVVRAAIQFLARIEFVLKSRAAKLMPGFECAR